jgi:hypothetical protein
VLKEVVRKSSLTPKLITAHDTDIFAWVPLLHTVKVKVPRNRPEGPDRVGVSVIAIPFLDLSARRGCVVSTTPRPLYAGKDQVPILQEGC